MDEKLCKKDFLTQKEVADYFNVVPGTVKNWRERGYFSYWQAPCSTRVLYFSDEIKDFRDRNTISKKGGDREKEPAKIKRKKPDISSTPDTQWRI